MKSQILITNNKNGFTLIESTVAIFLLMIGIFTVMEFFPFALRIIGNSQSLTIASNIALSKIEEIQSLDYELVNPGTIEVKQRVSSDPDNYLYKYQRQTVVETVDSNFDPSGSDVGFKKITVTVFWPSLFGTAEKSFIINHVISSH